MRTVKTYRTALMLVATLTLVGLTGGAAIFLTGCTDTLDGERYPNQKPVVHFANIPPEGQTFSRNPVVYWYGSDVDGLIDYYQYHVATEVQIGFDSPENYIMGIPVEAWTRIDVDPAASDPQTTHQIPLAADSTNPVRQFVVQYVFLQAYDMEGLGSDIVYRRFARNDNPPNTGINDFSTKLPFVNSATAGGAVTGIALDWWARDEIDYPNDPPPFEFQWRVYGPYTDDDTAAMNALFVQTVFQSIDGFVYLEGEYYKVCDTTYGAGGVQTIDCDSFLVGGAIPIDARLGRTITNYFNFADPAFVGNPAYNKLVDSSCRRDPTCLKNLPEGAPESDCPCLDNWVMATNQTGTSEWAGRDTLYNVFKNAPTDVTQKRNFLFWIRSRDDAKVPDPTPAWAVFDVIEPKFERDVLIYDWTSTAVNSTTRRVHDGYFNNLPATPRVYDFWRDALVAWKSDILFEPIDYLFRIGLGNAGGANYGTSVPLEKLLQYKVLILYNDHILAPPVNTESFMKPIITAIDAGLNAWSTGRAIAGGAQLTGIIRPTDPTNAFNSEWGREFKKYFAVNSGRYTGWYLYAYWKRLPNQQLLEADLQDCMGAYSLRPSEWPNLEYDSSYVHGLYGDWQLLSGPLYQAWVPELPYLPEINWCEARYGAEIMYLYKSHYGSRGVAHPLGLWRDPNGTFNFNYEGAPCGHRYNAGIFRTVHMNLTPFALKRSANPAEDQMKRLVKSVMDFLWDPNIQAPVAKMRYEDAAVPLSLAEQRAHYWKRCDWEAYQKGLDLSQHALENLRSR